MDVNSTKRTRSQSISDDSDSGSLTHSPSAKLPRLPTDAGQSDDPRLICTLPPTCSPPNRPSYIANSNDLEKHYALYHAHVREVKGCGCVFPEARLLELHLSECHDPLTEVRKERGERTFACFLPPPTCTRWFLTPKARRLHLMQAHGYPKEYFFAVTNKGIGGLLKKWGEGASLLRGEWKRRNHDAQQEKIELEDQESVALPEALMTTPGHNSHDRLPTATASMPGPNHDIPTMPLDDAMEEISSHLNSLSLVPQKIRFGRGGHSRGFMGPGKKNKSSREGSSSATRGIGSNTGHNAGDTARGRGPNFVVVNARGRGRGRIWVPTPP